MDANQFDRIVKSISAAGSRRGIVRFFAALPLAGVLATLLGAESDATRRRHARQRQTDRRGQLHEQRKKKKKKKKKPTVAPPVVPPPPVSPPPPPPLPNEVRCDPVGEESTFTFGRRLAQTFVAPRGGHVTAAEVYVGDNASGFSLTFDIRTVNALGVPTGDVLASTDVTGIPAPPAGEHPRISATFAPPAAITAGQRYALAITAPPPGAFEVWCNESDDSCPNQQGFYDVEASNAFINADTDFIFAVAIGE